MAKKVLVKYLKIEDYVTSHLFLFCCVMAFLACFIVLLSPIQRMNILSHVITYASCNLALIGFIFSLLLGMKGGEIHRRMERFYPSKVKELYWMVFRITIASSGTALLAIGIMMINTWGGIAKWVMTFIILIAFFYMILGTLFIFALLIRLMTKDISQKEDEGGI